MGEEVVGEVERGGQCSKCRNALKYVCMGGGGTAGCYRTIVCTSY